MTTTAITSSIGHRRDLSRLLPLGVLVAFVVVAVALRGVGGFPDNWNINLADPIDEFHAWVRDNQRSHPLFQYFFQPISDVVDWSLETLAEQLQALPWFALPLVVVVLIGRTGHWFTAAAVAVAITLPGMFGLWQPTMETLALMLVAVAISVLIGVPLGVAAGVNRHFYAFLRPVLDAMQTVPSTAFLVPAVLFFGIGPVPAAVATVVYAMAPVVRLTALGIRRVPTETVEAGHVFGSNRRQLLFKVQLPQAVPSILTGVNQTINMALGIIVIAALVGAGGLGQEALETLRLRSPGRGLVVGLAIVAVAVMLDRVSRSFIERRQAAEWASASTHTVAHRHRRGDGGHRRRPPGGVDGVPGGLGCHVGRLGQ